MSIQKYANVYVKIEELIRGIMLGHNRASGSNTDMNTLEMRNKNEETKKQNRTVFNVDTRTREKPRGVHELRNRSLCEK